MGKERAQQAALEELGMLARVYGGIHDLGGDEQDLYGGFEEISSTPQIELLMLLDTLAQSGVLSVSVESKPLAANNGDVEERVSFSIKPKNDLDKPYAVRMAEQIRSLLDQVNDNSQALIFDEAVLDHVRPRVSFSANLSVADNHGLSDLIGAFKDFAARLPQQSRSLG